MEVDQFASALSLYLVATPPQSREPRRHIRTMPRFFPFRPIATGPRDGSLIEVRHGPAHLIVRARWSKREASWVREGDLQRQALQQVTSWRPIGGKRASIV
jgi:hypothetical protein